MATIVGSYPHPVLGNQDDVSSNFQLQNAQFKPDVDDIEISFRVASDDPDLTRMLKSGEAELMARWDCPVTMSNGYLELDVVRQHADGTSFKGWLDQREVREDVRIDIFVVASKTISEFSWQNQHEDYAQDKFEIRKGDLLANGGFFTIKVGKLYDPMDPPVGSCFRITVDPIQKREIKVNFDDDEQVVILMSKEMASGFQELSFRPDLQISLVILPALMETISFIQKNQSDDSEEDLSDKTWFQTVSSLLRSIDSETSPIAIAQQLLGDVVTKVLTVSLFTEED
ncbi:hypothetical protein YH66_06230 [[Brevibacterium] flavum]|uniref:Uncharacterized protein n=1 Tax=[Brevibacterium] flavum TaxID=92706 RepID=A0A0F6Z5I7_9CORY|nr:MULTISPECIES: hypothetical protein [Corynebacterium]AKF27181.1 hypothetical protein YH66_06230 [[Brevibacterium] flavum]ANE08003.1 hypothetical protein A3654_06230 [Corynebacterium glutamicum]AST20421.1 hypothetical protein CEY17_06305 [Corynebacterium glutamicum ATCC 14067]KEI22907.1 hypothetical protein KIQ_010085 [Corynebacterium glutamicum ATCC 14067]KIH73806.1 hypothetical protein SD36_06255 [Corynebacterium glutamicum]